MNQKTKHLLILFSVLGNVSAVLRIIQGRPSGRKSILKENKAV